MLDEILAIDEMHTPKASFLTESEIEALQSSTLPRKTPFAIQGVMNTQLSIARFYGGIRYNGDGYTYMPDGDELIRDDVLLFVTKLRKKQRKTEKAEFTSKQMEF